MTEAVAQLTKGLEALAKLPEGIAGQQRELDLRLALGPALIATQGWAAQATGETYTRAGALCEQLDQQHHVGAVLFGQFTYQNLRGEFRLAHETAAAILRIGDARNDALLISLGHHVLGYNYISLGEFTLARAELEQTLIAVFDPALRSAATELTDADQLVMTLVHLAWPLGCLGYLHQARARREAAIAEARRLGHAFTLAFALAFALGLGLYGAEETLQTEMLWAEELLALSTEHGFALWKTTGAIHRGRCLATEGRAAEGIAQMTEGLAAFRNTGAVALLPRLLTLIAEAYGRAWQPLAGLEHLTEAIHIVERTEGRESEAELYRVRGQLLLALRRSGRRRRELLHRARRSLGAKAPSCGNSVSPPASPASGATRASAPRPATFSRPSTTGSPKASTCRTSRRRSRCWSSSRHERGPQLARGDRRRSRLSGLVKSVYRLASRDRGVYEVAVARKDLTTRG
jgi:hypothetical protein